MQGELEPKGGHRRSAARRAIHGAFQVGVVLKGIDGMLELAGAALLVAIPPRRFARAVSLLTQHELSEDPHDFIARHLVRAAAHLSVGMQTFAWVYLFIHGVVKVALVWALLRRRLWAYPVAIAIFFAFGAYQLYRYSLSHSTAMLVLTAIDVFVILLTWVEWGRLRREAPPGRGAELT